MSRAGPDRASESGPDRAPDPARHPVVPAPSVEILDATGGRPALVWVLATPWRALASTVAGGGLGERSWILNARIERDYHRHDPEAHVAEMARELGLAGEGIGFLTAADVRDAIRMVDGGVVVDATVGLTEPIWASAPDAVRDEHAAPGTVNVVAIVPARLTDAALVNAATTATEAKAQALAEVGVAGTGTASDAVAVLCPTAGAPERYGGPRSRWGARLARAVHGAVVAGARATRTRDLDR